MNKSLYQDEVFAEYWNHRAGDNGEVYKRYVLDPLMFELMGNISGKVVLELGCGNGYLASKFIAQNPKRVIMMDISAYNLKYAAEKCNDDRCVFIEQDATEAWRVESSSVDVVYSIMMLNEVEDITSPISEAYRVLNDDGVFVFTVTHPAWDLFVYAQEKAGLRSKKFKNLGGYFRRGPAHFVMGGDSKNNPGLSSDDTREFILEHYQRPLSDYFSQLAEAGFTVKKLLEPELTEALLQKAPRFAEYGDLPIGLVFYCVK